MVHPNPADDEILIRCSLPEEAFGRFELISSTGQLVVSINIPCGEGETRLDTKNINPGIYFYSLNVNGLSKGRGKLVVIH